MRVAAAALPQLGRRAAPASASPGRRSRRISSRTICTTFWCTRQPAGSHVHRPGADLADEARRGPSACARAPRRRRAAGARWAGRAGSRRVIGRRTLPPAHPLAAPRRRSRPSAVTLSWPAPQSMTSPSRSRGAMMVSLPPPARPRRGRCRARARRCRAAGQPSLGPCRRRWSLPVPPNEAVAARGAHEAVVAVTPVEDVIAVAALRGSRPARPLSRSRRRAPTRRSPKRVPSSTSSSRPPNDGSRTAG